MTYKSLCTVKRIDERASKWDAKVRERTWAMKGVAEAVKNIGKGESVEAKYTVATSVSVPTNYSSLVDTLRMRA